MPRPGAAARRFPLLRNDRGGWRIEQDARNVRRECRRRGGIGPAGERMADVGVIGRRVRRPTAPGLSGWTDRHIKWLLVAPAILLILALSIYPLAYSLWVSFVNYDFQIPGHAFVGLQNFAEVIADPIARQLAGHGPLHRRQCHGRVLPRPGPCAWR